MATTIHYFCLPFRENTDDKIGDYKEVWDVSLQRQVMIWGWGWRKSRKKKFGGPSPGKMKF